MFHKLTGLLDFIESVLTVINFLVADDFQLPTAIMEFLTKVVS
ncbi:hypothetical protein [Vibrio sp. MED222]|nr:hypothetical protein [Vibrio sp. MED222]EAQ55521.1 hypothetical protein MED222_08873 [Vibrio sp. MED222]